VRRIALFILRRNAGWAATRQPGRAGMDLQQVVETTVEGLEFELVALERAGGGLLRVFIDHPDGISVDDCVLVSDQLSRVFTVENVDYERLEVSSPGMDRPLIKPAHFARFVGSQVKLKLRAPRDGRKVFSGRLLEVQDGGVRIELGSGPADFAFDAIDRANLVPEF
jgi:ribosome maturation factor RimP